MTMKELAVEYRESAALLKARVGALQERLGAPGLREMDKLRLRGRICTLQSMYRDVTEAAVVMEHYYDRGYRRNERYTI